MTEVSHNYLIMAFLEICLLMLYLIKRNVKRDHRYVLLIFASIFHLFIMLVLANYHVYPSLLNDFSAKFLFYLDLYLILFICFTIVVYLISSYYTKIDVPNKVILYATVILVFVEVLLTLSNKTVYFIRKNNYHLEMQFGPYIYFFYIIIILFFLFSIYLLYKQKNKTGSINFYQYSVILTLLAISLIFLNISETYFFDIIVILFLGITYYNIESPARYIILNYKVQNKEAFKKSLSSSKLKEKKTFVMLKLKNVEYLTGTIVDTNKLKIVNTTIKNFQKSYGFNNIYYLGHGLIVYSVKNNFSIHNLIEKFKSQIDKRIERDLPFSIYPLFLSLTYEKGEIIDFLKFEKIIEGFLEESKNMKPFEVLSHSSEYINNELRKEKIIETIKKAISKDGFTLSYQPIINLKTGQFDTCECFVRIFDVELGTIFSDEFVPIAKKMGLKKSIDLIVLKKICIFLEENQDELNLKFITINMSLEEFCDKQFLADAIYIIDVSKIKRDSFVFELRETNLKYDENILMRNMTMLNKQDIKISVDKYGLGYSSLDFISAYPIDIIKIGMNIFNRDKEEKFSNSILKNLLIFCEHLNKRIVIEDINKKNDYMEVKKYNAKFMQGDYFCKPLVEKKVLRFFKKGGFKR